MAGSKLNVALWNLSAGVAVAGMAGCGPLIGGAEDDGGSDTDTGPDDDDDGPMTDTIFPETETTPTETDPNACEAGCPPGYYCLNGECYYEDYYCGTGGCCYDECCYEGCYYNDCSVAEDCADGEFCYHDDYYGECLSAESLQQCEAEGALNRIIALPDGANAGAVTLAFGDAEEGGGDELLIVSVAEARVVTGGGSTVTNPVSLEANTATSAVPVQTPTGVEFAVSNLVPEGVHLLFYALDTLAISDPSGNSLDGLVAGDFNGDGTDDVAGTAVGDAYWMPGNGGGFPETFGLPIYSDGPLTVGEFDEDGRPDLAYHTGFGRPWVAYNIADGRSETPLPGGEAVTQTLATGDFDGDTATDIVGLTSVFGTLTVFGWYGAGNGFAGAFPLALPDVTHEGHYTIATGDFDGDGQDDVVIGSADSRARILFGGDSTFSCWADVPLPHPATVLATGDIDNDGRADLAFSDGVTTTVLGFD